MDSAYYQEEQETSVSAKEALRGLLPLLSPHRKRLYINLVLLIIANGLSLLSPVIIQKTVDLVTSPASSTAGTSLPTVAVDALIPQVMWMSLIYVIVLLAFLIANYAQRVHLEVIGQDVITDLKQRCFNHVVGLSVSFFDRNPVGRLLSRVESDGEALRQFFSSVVVLIIGDALKLVGIFAILFYYSWQLTLAVLALAPVVITLIYFYQRYTTPRFLGIRKKMADVIATMTEFLQGMSVVQAFNRQQLVRDRMNEANRQKFRLDAEAHLSHTTFFNLVFFVENVGIAAVTFFGATVLVGQVTGTGGETMTVGTILLFIMFMRMFFEPIHRAAEELHVLQRAIAGARRVFALMKNDERIPEPPQPRVWSGFENVIRFENVGLSYNGNDRFALRNASFEIAKGEKVALVGVTGGGKSTIVNLLLRFYDATEGRITVDGIDIRDLHTTDLRSKFGLVLQDIFLFPGNVRDNITLEQSRISAETLESASQLVTADRFIERMPKKYETEISERGANLSRGERQLLSFARTMVFDPQILLLDEATSSVDPDTEKQIQLALDRLLAGRTSLIIAHRLSTILDADKILVIREGQIIERGTHRELLAQGGYYEKLYRLQFQGPEIVKVANVEKV